jgi:hypothetical protein
MPGLYNTPLKDTLDSTKASVDLLSNSLTPLFNKLWDEVENMAVKNKSEV